MVKFPTLLTQVGWSNVLGLPPGAGGEGGRALKFRIDRRLTAVGLSMVGGFQGSKVQLISSG